MSECDDAIIVESQFLAPICPVLPLRTSEDPSWNSICTKRIKTVEKFYFSKLTSSLINFTPYEKLRKYLASLECYVSSQILAFQY